MEEQMHSHMYIDTYQKLWRHTCIIWCALPCRHHLFHICKHIKGVQISRPQVGEGVSLCPCLIRLNVCGILAHQVGVGRLIITLSEPRESDRRGVHITHCEVSHCFGHCSKYSKGLCIKRNATVEHGVSQFWVLLNWCTETIEIVWV